MKFPSMVHRLNLNLPAHTQHTHTPTHTKEQLNFKMPPLKHTQQPFPRQTFPFQTFDIRLYIVYSLLPETENCPSWINLSQDKHFLSKHLTFVYILFILFCQKLKTALLESTFPKTNTSFPTQLLFGYILFKFFCPKLPSWISRRERMTVEYISWSNLHKRMLWTRPGSNPQPPDHQSDVHPTEPLRSASNIRHACIAKG